MLIKDDVCYLWTFVGRSSHVFDSHEASDTRYRYGKRYVIHVGKKSMSPAGVRFYFNSLCSLAGDRPRGTTREPFTMYENEIS